jgi:hypothetical protein
MAAVKAFLRRLPGKALLTEMGFIRAPRGAPRRLLPYPANLLTDCCQEGWEILFSSKREE